MQWEAMQFRDPHVGTAATDDGAWDLRAKWPLVTGAAITVALIYAMIAATALSGLQYLWRALLLLRAI